MAGEAKGAAISVTLGAVRGSGAVNGRGYERDGSSPEDAGSRYYLGNKAASLPEIARCPAL